MAIKAESLLVNEKASIREAMQVIDAGHCGMALVVDESGRFKGIVTDGDVRRAIIQGAEISTPVERVTNESPFALEDPVKEEEVVTLVQSEKFQRTMPGYIPSLDVEQRPVMLYHLSELLSFRISKVAPAGERPLRVLLLGGAGYIGSILTRMLLDAGYNVIIVDSFLYGDYSIAEVADHPNLTVIHGDTRHIDILVPAIRQSDAVVHLAELVGDPLCAKDPETTYEINYLATETITRICSELQVNRYVYLSSCSVYGASIDPEEILDEHSALAPVSIYARMKINAERSILSIVNPNFAPCIFRLGTVFGLSYRPRFDLVVNVLSAKAAAEGKIDIFGGGQWRPHIHAADVARAIKLALESPLESVRNQVFNLVGENMRIADIGSLVKDVVPGTRVEVHDDAVDKRNYRVRGDKVEEVLGFEPKCMVEDGVREIVEAIRSKEILNYSDAIYHNYRSQFMDAN